jgi:hypothetical protein
LARRPTDPTWQGIIVTTAVVLLIPLLLWAASNTLAATMALATASGIAVGGRRARRLRRCLAACGGFTLEPVGDLRVRVTRGDAAENC